MIRGMPGNHLVTNRSAARNTRRAPFGDDYGSWSGKTSFAPLFFHPRYNEEDLDNFEDLWAHTLAGDCIDVRINHAVGDGFKPVAKWRHPKKHGDTEEAQNEGLKEYDDLMDELVAIDELPEINLYDNVRDMARMAKVFGRGALVFESSNDKSREDIPTFMKAIHPRMLGRVFTRQDSWDLDSVYIHTKIDQAAYADEMIYFCNMVNSPLYRNMWYGYSDMHRVAGQATALREITEFDVLEIVKSMFAGYGIVAVDQENIPDDEKENDLNTIMNNLKPGAFTAITKQNEKDIDFSQFKFETDISGLTQLIQHMERMIIGHGQVPGALLGREEDANLATLHGKIRSFLHGPVRHDRRWIGKTLQRWWYDRNAEILQKGVLKEIKIEVQFENLPVDAWLGVINEIGQLRQLLPTLPDSSLLKLADLDFLIDTLAAQGMSTNSQLEQQEKETNKEMAAAGGMGPPQGGGPPQNEE